MPYFARKSTGESERILDLLSLHDDLVGTLCHRGMKRIAKILIALLLPVFFDPTRLL